MIYNEVLLKAISWTLVHSIWQGFILAILAGLTLSLTKKSTATLRYNLLAVLFIVFLGCSGLTFNYEYQDNEETVTRLNLPLLVFNKQLDASQDNNITSFAEEVIDYLNSHATAIAIIWFLIFSIKCFRMFGAFRHVYRIRNYQTIPAPYFWGLKLGELSEKVRLNKTIELLESRLIKVPMVTGFFKPIILVPVGMFTGLPNAQIEAILLHELAHIRRKDYAVNLLQQFAETVFFFNPGVLWLSSLIKDERENCCDDIAITITGSKTEFVHALVSFEEYNMKKNQLAVGFGGKKKHLLERAKRIIYNNNKPLNYMEKAFLSIGLFIVAGVIIACSNKSQEVTVNPPAIKTAEQVAIETDSVMAEADFHYAEERRKLAEEAAAVAEKYRILEQKYAKKRKISKPVYGPQTYSEAMSNANECCDTNTKGNTKVNVNANTSTNINTKATINTNINTKVNTKINTTIAPKEEKLLSKFWNYLTSSESTYEKTSTKEDDGKKVEAKIGVTSNGLISKDFDADGITQGIIDTLLKEKVISGVSNLSYKLSDKNLIVNGKEQDSRLHQKLKSKYLKPGLTGTYYNFVIN